MLKNGKSSLRLNFKFCRFYNNIAENTRGTYEIHYNIL